LTIAIDGADGCGKSSLASWLAWQLGAVTIYLDIYVVKDSNPLAWRVDDLERAMTARLKIGPVIVEGIMVLDALDCLTRKPDFLIFVNGRGSRLLADRIEDYRARQRPRERANFELDGFKD
jgi:uridine kinase